ncbi:MAG: extracellular solute-binding protein [Spirochaetaceae bacterium]|jgi:microcin C transport system substrate-binding protein|nr:extracellular solute-binding protein [Spirochaetaceae bacterium]
MKKNLLSFLSLFVIALSLCFAENKDSLTSGYYLSLRDAPVYKDGFTHFNYVNPDAPKRGRLTLAAAGTYDSFHRYALRGSSAAGSEYFYDSLMTSSGDEVDVLYPLIARKVEYPSDYSYFIFDIDPRAQDNEGRPIHAEDVVFSFYIIYEKGVPQFRSYYSGVKVTALSGNRVRYDIPPALDDNGNPQKDINGNTVYNKELMMTLAGAPIFPKHFWESHDFAEPLITPPVGTGPYRVKEYKMGQSVTLERVKDYWAADLPVNKGRYNFEIMHYDYYRDANVAFEAFKAGEYDLRIESSPKNWATQYTGKWIKTEDIIREEIPNQIAQPVNAFVFNITRPVFSERKTRIALGYFFDFQWMNKNFFYNTYTRTRSYFQNTMYEAKGLPSAEEIRALEAVRDLIPAEVFTQEYNPPVTDGTGNIRNQAREALSVFKEAGWELKNQKLLNAQGEHFSFELLLRQADTDTERVAITFQRNLERYGIDMKIRSVDDSQFINRLRSRDFDMISWRYLANQTPSSDLMIVWNTKHIDSTWNIAGVSDPAIDYLTTKISENQEDGEKLLALGRALDRVLTWNSYLIPEWNLPSFRIAFKNKFGKPAVRPKYDVGIETWWIK